VAIKVVSLEIAILAKWVQNLHDLHLIGVELRSYPMGNMLVAMANKPKEMILTHGECERLSICLGSVVEGVDTEKKKKKSSPAAQKFNGLDRTELRD
jgi:hypothetical protein